MTTPIIAITAGRHQEVTLQAKRQTVRVGCDVDFVRALTTLGAAPVLLPPTPVAEQVDAVVDRLDGLLLAGGGDVVATVFGAQPHPTTTGEEPTRDWTEFRAIERAVTRNLPILGVCRGMQVLNIAFGGDIFQDIASAPEISSRINHFARPFEPVAGHTIDLAPGTLMHRLAGADRMAVNSYHHQAPRRLGHGLRIAGMAPDGVIEAIESTTGRPVLGVQCHPEELWERHAPMRAILQWLVDEARRHAEDGANRPEDVVATHASAAAAAASAASDTAVAAPDASPPPASRVDATPRLLDD